MTTVDFSLKDARAHVRATDVLAAILARYPDGPVILRFARPLPGPARLDAPARPGASIIGHAGEVSFSLTPDPDAIVARHPADPSPALHLGGARRGVFAFPPGTPLPTRIVAIFDRLHPLQAERFLVRQITLRSGRVRLSPLLLTSLVVAPDRTRAELALHTPLGPLGTIGFRLTSRD